MLHRLLSREGRTSVQEKNRRRCAQRNAVGLRAYLIYISAAEDLIEVKARYLRRFYDRINSIRNLFV